MAINYDFLQQLTKGIPIDPLLDDQSDRDPSVPHAPCIKLILSKDETVLSVSNALRYFPPHLHSKLGPEFEDELINYGHIYMYRFIPKFKIKAYPIHAFPAKILEAKSIMLMIMNNLDHAVAQFPHELVTYGGNGQVFSNWAQFWLTMKYLSEMTSFQTLSMYSGHPMGLFPSVQSAPRVTITNGIMIPNYSSKEHYHKLFQLNVTMYGQMTAGSYCYIGPQGIVHGTTLTILNASRKYLNTGDLTGKVFLTSGLGGMSGAQAKAAVICGCIGIIAEVSKDAIQKRHRQGWLDVVTDDVNQLVLLVNEYKLSRKSVSIGFHGNIIAVWRKFVDHYNQTGTNLIDLASDQTSCHNPFGGGYYPEELSYDEANDMIKSDPEKFKRLVEESLKTHVRLINELSKSGTHFWDYGNAFLLEAHRAGADLDAKQLPSRLSFKYPSYVQDIMGDIFSLGFGPFRWVCTSGQPDDLKKTDEFAVKILNDIMKNNPDLPESVKGQYRDNIHWIQNAAKHNLVVGSQARILYSDQEGRIALAVAFNQAVRDHVLNGPVVISRDHHDVSGADSPFRETSNIYDGSNLTADMSVQNFIGDSVRGK